MENNHGSIVKSGKLYVVAFVQIGLNKEKVR